MARVKLTNMDNHAEEIVGARSLQLHVLPTIPAPGTIRVRQHVQLEREAHWGVHLTGSAVATALLELEALNQVSICGVIEPSRLTLSCIDSTLGKRLMLVCLLAC